MKYIFYQGRISLTNVSERKDKMRLGMTLASNPKDNSFVVNIKCYLLKLQLFSVWQYVTDSPDPMGRIIIWLHKMIISLDFHPFFAAQRLLYVVFLNTCVFVLGLWASLVLRMWQLVLQHRHLLQSQCKLQVLQNDSTCLSEYAFECLFSWMKIYELFVIPAGDVFSTCTYCILSGFRITHKCFFRMWDVHGHHHCSGWLKLHLPLDRSAGFSHQHPSEVLCRTRSNTGVWGMNTYKL